MCHEPRLKCDTQRGLAEANFKAVGKYLLDLKLAFLQMSTSLILQALGSELEGRRSKSSLKAEPGLTRRDVGGSNHWIRELDRSKESGRFKKYLGMEDRGMQYWGNGEKEQEFDAVTSIST